jgi:vacuolar-type H+-ATPase subunit I/STV1
LDPESLSHTATGFKGIMDASQQRMDLIARIFADTGVKEIFRRIVELASKHQKDSQHIRVLGKTFEVNPTDWRYNLNCYIDVGMGSGDRQEKIFNLNNILSQQGQLKQTGSMLVDEKKIYNTFDKLITELGLKDASIYFNDPEVPEEVLQAQNEQMKLIIQQFQANAQNPLAEAEMVKWQGQLALKQQQIQNDNQQFLMKLQQESQKTMAQMLAEQREHTDNLAAQLTELELKYKQDVPGASV